LSRTASHLYTSEGTYEGLTNEQIVRKALAARKSNKTPEDHDNGDDGEDEGDKSEDDKDTLYTRTSSSRKSATRGAGRKKKKLAAMEALVRSKIEAAGKEFVPWVDGVRLSRRMGRVLFLFFVIPPCMLSDRSPEAKKIDA
jgi:hypothetical protein